MQCRLGASGRTATEVAVNGARRPDDVRPHGHDAGDQPPQACRVRSETPKPALGETPAGPRPMTKYRSLWYARRETMIRGPQHVWQPLADDGVGLRGGRCHRWQHEG